MVIYNTIPNLFITAVNIVEFFLIIRAVILWKPINFLTPFDSAGKALTDTAIRLVQKTCSKLIHRQLSTPGSLIIAITIIELTKLLIVNVF